MDVHKAEQDIAAQAREDYGQALYEHALTQLRPSYTLTYTDYRDEFSPDDIEKILSGDLDSIDESVGEGFLEQTWDAECRIIEDLLGEDDAEKLRETEWYDQLRFAIDERDDSDIMAQLARNTGEFLCRYYLDVDVSDDADEIANIATALGIDATEHADKLAELIGNASYGGSLNILFRASLSSLLPVIQGTVWREEKFSVTWSNIDVLVYDGWNGSGYDVELSGVSLTVPFQLDHLHYDEHPKHGYSQWVCGGGYSRGYCEATFTKVEVTTPSV